jgi:hypothetical protein
VTHRAQSATPVNKEAIRILVQDHGYKTASELSGVKQATLRQWAKRGNWLRPKAGQIVQINHKQALSQTVTPSYSTLGDGHAQKVQEHRDNSLTHLARYAEESGRNLAESGGDLTKARAFQAIAAGRANLFPEQAPSTAIQVNVLSFEMVKDVEVDS